MINKNQRQQGDVCYEAISSIPEGAKKVDAKQGRFILAEGEVTGHAHAVIEESEVELFEYKGVLYLRNTISTEIKHEEHNPHTIEPGIWEFGIVNEYDYYNEITRKVAD